MPVSVKVSAGGHLFSIPAVIDLSSYIPAVPDLSSSEVLLPKKLIWLVEIKFSHIFYIIQSNKLICVK